MGWTSIDDMVNQLTTNGKYLRRDTAKNTTPAHTAGGWHLLSGLAGNPTSTTFPGTDLVWSNTDEFTGDGTNVFGILNGGPMSGSATKHLLSIGASVVAAAGAPWQLKLVDLQGYYRMSTTNVTGTGSRTLINSETFTANAGTDIITYAQDWKSGTKVRFTTTTTLPAGLSLATDYYLVRQSATTAKVASSYANYIAGTTIDITDAGTGTHTLTIQMPRYTDGVGCQAFFVAQTAPSTGGPTLSASSYTNTAGTSSRSFQGSVTFGAAADAYATRVIHSGNAAGRYGPFLPLAGGDTGIKSIESFTWSAGTAYTGSGVIALCIARPICDISVPVTGMWSERDLVNQLPSLPEIKNGANLQFMMFSTGATTNLSPVTAALDFGWGG
jgi:Fe-S cluster assembly iron-binding protein IscA